MKEKSLEPTTFEHITVIEKYKKDIMSLEGDKNQQSLSYMLVLFTSMNINSFKNIKEFIYEAECKQGKAKRKEFELLPPEINIEFYHLVYE